MLEFWLERLVKRICSLDDAQSSHRQRLRMVEFKLERLVNRICSFDDAQSSLCYSSFCSLRSLGSRTGICLRSACVFFNITHMLTRILKAYFHEPWCIATSTVQERFRLLDALRYRILVLSALCILVPNGSPIYRRGLNNLRSC
jgi:hypothetical protein